MNATFPQRTIDAAMERDAASAQAEYGAVFRSDVEQLFTREAIEAKVVPGRYELPYVSGTNYACFIDPSGGSADAMTLAIEHKDADGCPMEFERQAGLA
jgi:hypothetical protein